jgi:hypothetical protein
MPWEVLLLEPVNDWFLDLCTNDPLAADRVEEALDELAERGPELAVRWWTSCIAARSTV